MKGWVYIITTKAIPNLVKVGFSTKDPELRATELNNTGNPYPYAVEYDVLVNEPRNIEKTAHSLLKDYHENKEWFNCSIETAIIAIRKAADKEILLENSRIKISSELGKTADKNNKIKSLNPKNSEKLEQHKLQKNEQLHVILENSVVLQRIGKFIIKDGLAIDTETGLMWLRFSHGQTWENDTAINRAKGENRSAAFKIAKQFNAKGGYAGYSDWRLPSIEELKTLIDIIKCENGSYLNNSIFPNSRSQCWSSSPEKLNNDTECHYPLIMNFDNNTVYHCYAKDLSTIRLVRNIN